MIANVIAAPLAGYAMIRYLNSYAYHTSLGPVLFLIPAVMILMVALLTVSWQALRAAAADPAGGSALSASTPWDTPLQTSCLSTS